MPAAILAPFLSRMAATGLLLAIVSGFCLFSVRPAAYAANTAFLVKLTMLLLGSLNALALHRTAGWHAVLAGGAIAPVVALSAVLSAAVWLTALLAGRWIGFST